MRNKDAFSQYEEDDIGTFDYENGREIVEDEPKTVPKERFDEVNRQLQMEKESYHNMVKEMLSRQQPAQVVQQVQQPPVNQGPPEGIDEEAWKVLRPVLDQRDSQIYQRATQDAYGRFVNEFGDVVQYARRERGIQSLNDRVPGFEQELFEETKKLFNSLPPDEQERYNSEVGIEALANRVKLRMGGGEDFSDMAHSAPRGNSSRSEPGAQDVWNLSEDEFIRRYGD